MYTYKVICLFKFVKILSNNNFFKYIESKFVIWRPYEKNRLIRVCLSRDENLTLKSPLIMILLLLLMLFSIRLRQLRNTSKSPKDDLHNVSILRLLLKKIPPISKCNSVFSKPTSRHSLRMNYGGAFLKEFLHSKKHQLRALYFSYFVWRYTKRYMSVLYKWWVKIHRFKNINMYLATFVVCYIEYQHYETLFYWIA